MKKMVIMLVAALVVTTGVSAQFEEMPVEVSVFVPEIIIAARQGDVQAIEEFLQAGQYVDVADGYTWSTPLMTAAQWGKENTVMFLLRRGALVNKPDRYGRTALAFAAKIGSFNTVQTLLDFGADPNLYDTSGRTPLMLAAACGDCESVCSLISSGCDVSMACGGGYTAYEYAVASGNKEAAELIAEVSMP